MIEKIYLNDIQKRSNTEMFIDNVKKNSETYLIGTTLAPADSRYFTYDAAI